MSNFSLPGSSFEELKKIVLSYANSKPDAALADVAGMAGIHLTIVSRNNKFLSEVGLVEGGQKKKITELGKRLGRALEHDQSSDASESWAEAISSNEKFSAILTTVRIKSGMSEADLVKHILYVSEQANNNANKTGARCVLDVFVAAGLLAEKDGQFKVSKPTSPQKSVEPEKAEQSVSTGGKNHSDIKNTVPLGTSSVAIGVQPNITINIELQIPEASDPDTYDRLFKALRDNLFPPKN